MGPTDSPRVHSLRSTGTVMWGRSRTRTVDSPPEMHSPHLPSPPFFVGVTYFEEFSDQVGAPLIFHLTKGNPRLN